MKDSIKDSPVLEEQPLANIQEEKLYVASQWKLIWLKFKRHKLALGSVFFLILIYLMAIFSGFIAPYNPIEYNAKFIFAPPQRLRFFHTDGMHLRPFVYGFDIKTNMETLEPIYTPDPSKIYPIYFFVRGAPYKFWGLWKTDIRLFGVKEGYMFLLGADRLGRDMFSRIVYGSRISVSIGLIGVSLSLLLGILLGGISGYMGGLVDNIIQRVIELLRSIPTIPLWLGLSAALPAHWSPLLIYFGITIILSLLTWTALARVVRGKFISLREEQFVMAARLYGSSRLRIIFRHMVPSFTSHIIAVMTLQVPGMILAETSLSFLGLGLRPPVVSWGVLLQEAQDIRSVASSPWLLLPGLAVVIAVLAFSFMGDGLRDAADPYSTH